MEPERGCREEGSAQQAGAGPGLPAHPALPPREPDAGLS